MESSLRSSPLEPGEVPRGKNQQKYEVFPTAHDQGSPGASVSYAGAHNAFGNSSELLRSHQLLALQQLSQSWVTYLSGRIPLLRLWGGSLPCNLCSLVESRKVIVFQLTQLFLIVKTEVMVLSSLRVRVETRSPYYGHFLYQSTIASKKY